MGVAAEAAGLLSFQKAAAGCGVLSPVGTAGLPKALLGVDAGGAVGLPKALLGVDAGGVVGLPNGLLAGGVALPFPLMGAAEATAGWLTGAAGLSVACPSGLVDEGEVMGVPP